MTARQIYEYMLVELNKVEAPSMLLEDFNYFFNKAIYQYINKKYNIYDVNQQTTDDVRVLKSTVVLKPTNSDNAYGDDAYNSLYGCVKEFILPQDYLHILNCICDFKVKKQFKCYDANTHVQFGARRLTSDMWSQIINNFYMRPMYRRPYYFIHNVNRKVDGIPTNELPTDNFVGDIKDKDIIGKLIIRNKEGEQVGYLDDTVNPMIVTINNKNYLGYNQDGQYLLVPRDPNDNDVNTYMTNSTTHKYVIKTGDGNRYYVDRDDVIVSNRYEGPSRTITIGGAPHSFIEKNAVNRYGNSEQVRLEIRYGKDDRVFELDRIYVDYIKAPQHIRLTQEQLDLTEDTSQVLEFPDYVCQEIINELVKLMMENASDPRLQTNIPVNQTIASPAQQGQQPSK